MQIFPGLQIPRTDLNQVLPFRSFRLSLGRRSPGRDLACKAGVAVPPWMKSSPPGTPTPDGKTDSADRPCSREQIGVY